jgi:hypothetical protein
MVKRVIPIIIIFMLISISLRVIIIDANRIGQNMTTQENQYGKGFRYNIQGWVYVH